MCATMLLCSTVNYLEVGAMYLTFVYIGYFIAGVFMYDEPGGIGSIFDPFVWCVNNAISSIPILRARLLARQIRCTAETQSTNFSTYYAGKTRGWDNRELLKTQEWLACSEDNLHFTWWGFWLRHMLLLSACYGIARFFFLG